MYILLFACSTNNNKDPLPLVDDADVYSDNLGASVSWIDPELKSNYEDGKKVMEQAFTTKNGLGPTFNADSCAGCHQAPVSGGSAPRYRDLWLIKTERWDGALINAGTNGLSPVRNLYANPPTFHIPEDPETVLYARRNAPPGFGVGLFAFIEDETILANSDINDENNDGISGRANFEQGRVGRFGYKSQAFSLESFNRGAMFNQMGITSNPIYYSFIENPDGGLASLLLPTKNLPTKSHNDGLFHWFDITLFNPIATAFAQVSAPDEPTVDDDGVTDPEMSDTDQRNLLIFSTYLAAPRPKSSADYSTAEREGAIQFSKMGCVDCHIPRLDSKIGPIRAYSDLLLHDMGSEMDDGITPGFASGSEFRTQPLWGVALHGPYLHDGRANTLQEAIEWHGGEGTASKDNWLNASEEERDALISFLYALGGENPEGGNFILPSSTIPKYGEPGGPRRELTTDEEQTFENGLRLFDQNFLGSDGRNNHFNADSCRACHQDPVIGGAGGIDVNVLRAGKRDLETGLYEDVSTPLLYRSSGIDKLPQYLDSESNIIEARQPISLLGIGYIDEIPDNLILQNADEFDEDNDGISGRVRYLEDGRVGRFGWKAQIPSLSDFVADALLVEIGITVHSDISDFTVENDNDTCSDPELFEDDFIALSFFLQELSSPTVENNLSDDQFQGKQIFEDIGCTLCHIPTINSIPLYSDLLLHDVAKEELSLVEQDDSVLATEFRTPPLWGVSQTPPYMHDGSAATLEDAILQHDGESVQVRQNYTSLSEAERKSILLFLEGI